MNLERGTPIRAVTFDVGGTLIYPWPSVGHVYAEIAARHGIKNLLAEQITHQFLRAWKVRGEFDYSKAGWASLVESAFHGFIPPGKSIDIFEDIYRRFGEPDAWKIYDDVIPTLDSLSALGIKLAIISNWDERLEPLLEAIGLSKYFDVLSVSHTIGCCKPSPRIFSTTLEKLGVLADEAVHVGDSLREDIEGASAAGLRRFLIDRNASGKEALSSISDLREILRHLS